jgi:hypothetical protein
MRDRAGPVGHEAMSARRARDVAVDRTAQALHEAQYARIRAGALDAAGAYDEGRISWERAHDAAERATAWQQIHDHWYVVLHGRVPAPRQARDDVPHPSRREALAS